MEIIQTNFFEGKKSKLIILGIMGIGFAIRAYFMPWDLPSSSPDTIVYLVEALNYSKLNFNPIFNVISRIIWPGLLSTIFYFFNFENYFGYLTIMRIASILISITTIPIIFLVSQKFVNTKYSILGCIMFALEPNIIENSLLAITEPLFILLGLSAFFYSIHHKEKFLILSFIFAGLSFDTRLNGIILIIFVLVVTITKIKLLKNKFRFLVIGIFIMMILSTPHFISSDEQIKGKELGGMTTFEKISDILETPFKETGTTNLSSNNSSNIFDVLQKIIFKEIIHIGRISIPFTFIFIPLGIIAIFSNFTYNKKLLIFIIALIGLIAIPAYFGAATYRHILFMIPFLILIGIVGIEWIMKNKKHEKQIYLIIIIITIFSSIYFLENNTDDKERIQEQNLAGAYIAKNLSGLVIGDNYVYNIQNIVNLDNIPIDHEGNGEITIKYSTHPLITKTDLEKYLIENSVDYVIIDSIKDNRYPIFEIIYTNEKEFPYLEKIYDSKNYGYKKYHFKIFKTNLSSILK